MYKIQTNNSGTRHIDVSEENLQTIEKYALLGLRELIMLYLSWSEQKEE